MAVGRIRLNPSRPAKTRRPERPRRSHPPKTQKATPSPPFGLPATATHKATKTKGQRPKTKATESASPATPRVQHLQESAWTTRPRLFNQAAQKLRTADRRMGRWPQAASTPPMQVRKDPAAGAPEAEPPSKVPKSDAVPTLRSSGQSDPQGHKYQRPKTKATESASPATPRVQHLQESAWTTRPRLFNQAAQELWAADRRMGRWPQAASTPPKQVRKDPAAGAPEAEPPSKVPKKRRRPHPSVSRPQRPAKRQRRPIQRATDHRANLQPPAQKLRTADRRMGRWPQAASDSAQAGPQRPGGRSARGGAPSQRPKKRRRPHPSVFRPQRTARPQRLKAYPRAASPTHNSHRGARGPQELHAAHRQHDS